MKKTIQHILLALAIVVTVAIAAMVNIILLLNTSIAQKQAQRIIAGVMPGSITWEYLSISPLSGRVEIRKAALAGKDRKLIAGFNRLTARISVSSAFRGKLDIADARIEKPECFLEMDSDGRLNIVKAFGIRPKKKIPDKKPGRLPGFLLVRRCVLANGSFGFSRPAGNFDLVIRDIACTAGLDFAAETGAIDLTVGTSFFTVKDRRTDIRRLALDSAVRNGMARRLHLKLRTTSSDIAVRGDIRELFRNPSFDVSAAFSLSMPELHDILDLKRPLSGLVTGALYGRGMVNNPSVSVTARYSGGTILGSDTGPISADLAMTDRVVTITGIRAVSGTGYIDLRGAMDMRKAYPEGFIRPGRDNSRISYTITATSRGFSLRSIPGFTGRVRGLIDADCALSGTGFSPGSATATLDLKATVPGFAAGDKGEPAHLTLRARADMSEGTLRVREAEANLAGALIRAGGTYTVSARSLQGSFSLAAPEIAPAAASLSLANTGGTLNAGGTLAGTIRRPLVTANLSGSTLRFGGMMIGNVSIRSSLDDTGTVTIDRLMLANRSSKISLKGSAGLFGEGFAVRRNPPISLLIEQFDVEAGDFQGAYAGRITLAGQVAGTLLDPSGSLAMNGEAIDLGFQKFNSMKCAVSFSDRKARIDPFLATVVPGESIRCDGWIGTDRSYDLSLVSDPISLSGIQVIDTSTGLRGRLILDLKGSGSLADPSFGGTLTATQVAVNDAAFNDMTVKLALRKGLVTLKGNLNFDIDASYKLGSRRFRVAALFDRTDLAPLLSVAGRKNLGGTVSGTIRAEGSAAAPAQSSLSIRLTQLDLFSAGERLVRSAMFDAGLNNGVVTIPGIRLFLLDSGWITITGRGNLNSYFAIDLDSSIPLKLANRFTDTLTDFSGNLSMKGRMTGSVSHPHLNADLSLERAGFTIPSIGNDVRDLNGRISFTPEKITIHDIRGLMGQGSFGIKGTAGVSGLKLHDMNIEAGARSLPIDIPDMMHLTFDADARITGSSARSSIRGDFTLIDGVYYQDLALHPLQDFGRPADVRPKGPDKTGISLLDSMAMNVTIASRQPFAVENNIASLKISTDLDLVGTLKKPVLRGSARVESGVVHYLGKDFDITRGKIDFINPYRIDPIISISSNARIQKWLISIAVSGTPAALRYDLSSSPVLDSSSILSLILLGKTPGGTLTYSTTELLGQILAFNYGAQIKKSTGIDTIEIKTQETQKKGAAKGQVVTFGKYLDRRFSVYYSIGMNNREVTTGSAVKYKLSDSILLNLDYDTKGNVGIDMQYSKEFR